MKHVDYTKMSKYQLSKISSNYIGSTYNDTCRL